MLFLLRDGTYDIVQKEDSPTKVKIVPIRILNQNGTIAFS